ncbi:caspase family protein [Phaeodactylibacter xiamenensis]|uniref:caspase family protein n=1 Tax=Phaeodactylibacter xiamenensis TaxID=1524460 RepID=UPI0024A89CBD|nr:caspase family protein [Phaeodactylibacter xiamenensis]
MRRAALFALLCTVFTISLTAQIDCKSGDCINGEGVCIYPSGARYEGRFRDGKPQGNGTLIFSDGREYTGDWKNGFKEGRGILTYPNGDKYTGDFRDNKFHGRGIMAYANDNRYEGFWVNGQQSGKGTFHFANGDRYEGGFMAGQFNGMGRMYYSDGSVYDGQWKDNDRHGRGNLSFSDGEEIVGEWSDGQYLTDWSKFGYEGDTTNLRNCNNIYCQNGKGKFTYEDGSKYVGDFREGQPEGHGTVYYVSGSKYMGSWKDHTPHGRGVMYYASGRVVGAIWDFGKPAKKLFIEGGTDQQMPVAVERDPEVKIWAVIIGAATYSYMPTLRYTDDDAYQLYAFLKSPQGGAIPDNQMRLLIDEDATYRNIKEAMRTTFMRADENDVILFYFSGHGLQGFFMPVDYDGYHNKLMHEDIKFMLENSRAKHKVVLADACHSGSLLARRGGAAGDLSRLYKAFEDTKGGLALMMSSKGEEYSLEDGGLRSGIFSHFMVRGLKGEADNNHDGIVNIQELFDFVHQQVRRYTGNVQTPTLTGEFDHRMPIAVVRED